MPVGSFEEATKGTWAGRLILLSKELVNNPRSTKDCWFVALPKSGGHQVTIGNKKTSSRQTHATLYALLIGKTKHLHKKGKGNSVHRHKCGHGSIGITPVDSIVCINPWHIVHGTQADNRDDEGCKYGARALCPHDPPCIFTHVPSGKPKPCLSELFAELGPGKCKHTVSCY